MFHVKQALEFQAEHMAADETSFWRALAFRVALYAGLSAGPVLAVLWPVFVRLESGVWPASPLALTVAMLYAGHADGCRCSLYADAAGAEPHAPAAGAVTAPDGLRGRRRAVSRADGGVRGHHGVERLGAQWPLWLVLTIAGAVCGWIGALAVPAARSKSNDQPTDRAP